MPPLRRRRPRRRSSTLVPGYLGRPEEEEEEAWVLRPGDPGFNAYARRRLQAAAISPHLACPSASGPTTDLWHQRILAWLVRPATPIHRLLVVWQLGSGKTLGMLRVLDSYYDDPRPKILVFPNEALVDNFYAELLRHPNRYQTWLRTVAGLSETATLADARRWLEQSPRHPDNLRLPPDQRRPSALKAFPYSLAGGRTLLKHWPAGLRSGSPEVVARRYADPRGLQCLHQTIVLCDEAHNLVRPRQPPLTQVQVDNVREFGERIRAATEAVIVCFTATPIVERADEADALLSVVTGRAVEPASPLPEGYVSWFMDRPPQLFAVADPPPHQLPHLNAVRIDAPGPEGTDNPLFEHYLSQRFFRGQPPRYGPTIWGNAGTILDVPAPYRGACVGRQQPQQDSSASDSWHCRRTLASYEHLAYWWMHESQHTRRLRDPTTAAELAPKLNALARSIADTRDNQGRRLKTVVLIHRESGLRTLHHLLNVVYGVPAVASEPERSSGTGGRTNREHQRVFDAPTNRYGDVVPVFLAASEEFSEGVSFRNVRRIILADLSPGNSVPSWSLVKQRVARALRVCSHQDLSPEDRTLRIDLFVAIHERPGLPPTLDMEKLTLVRRQRIEVEGGMERLRAAAIDAPIYIR